MKICFYIITKDGGIAPNPFYNFCTLALCTPNHMRAHLEKGDWIVGCFRSGKPPRVVFIMEIDEVMPLGDYYSDSRFICKRPSSKDWKTKCGDNMYYLDSQGELKQDHNALYHLDNKTQEKDKRGNRVFVGTQFVYWGGNAILLPTDFNNCLPLRQGIKYLHRYNSLCQKFINWSKTLGKGCMGYPRDARMTSCKERFNEIYSPKTESVLKDSQYQKSNTGCGN